MKSKLLSTVTLFLLFFQPNLYADECVYIYNFNEDNKAEVYEEIIWFLDLENHLNDGHGTVEMRWIKHKLDSLLGLMPFSGNVDPQEESFMGLCDGGPFSKEGTHVGDICEITFEWDDYVPDILQYSTYYLNLDITSGIVDTPIVVDGSTFSEENKPKISLDVPYLGKHLFAINTRCATSQSDYTIIIAEKIITTSEFFCELAPEPGMRLKKSEQENTLTILPNLAASETQIKFQLFEDNNTTISLYNGSTGGQVKEVFSSKNLAEGVYSIHLDTNDLASGVYFIIMYTNHQRIIKRMVKL